MRLFTIFFLGCLLAATGSFAQGGTVYYVNAATGSDAAIGTGSWSNAFKTLQKALQTAGSGAQIWVAKGTYYPDEGGGKTNNDRNAAFVMKNDLSIYGGFAGEEAQLSARNWTANPTILSGDIDQNDGANFANNGGNSLRVVSNNRNGLNRSAVLDGFTVSGGNANTSQPFILSGGGMYNDGSSPTVANCTFSGNTCEIFGGGMYNTNSSNPGLTNCTFANNQATYGGGIYNDQSSPTFTNCGFSGNAGKYYGGGMGSDRSSPVLTNCTFSGNQANNGGGGMSNANSSPALTNCSFSGNSTNNLGGGIYNNYFSSPTFTNCIFLGNSSNGAGGNGGVMYNDQSSPTFTNCSFSGNRANYGGVMLNEQSSLPRLTNCIIWGNSSGILQTDGTVTITYSLVQGLSGGTNGNLDGNINPLFVQTPDFSAAPTAVGNLRLQVSSPALNKGSNAAVPTGVTTDLDGNARIQTGTVDMGAYETCQSVGDPTVFGQNEWKVYAFNASGLNTTPAAWQDNYAGYYTASGLNFNTEDSWPGSGSPSNATGYQGCPVQVDNMSYTAKRQGFLCGYYSLDVPGHDDGAQLWINGKIVWSEDYHNPNPSTNVWSGWLGATDRVEFRMIEGTGSAFGKLTFHLANNTSNGNPSVFGNNQWNVYAFNSGNGTIGGSDWSSNYSGYYTTSSLNVNTENDWSPLGSPSQAAGYQGCTVNADNFSISAKRQGFTCGYYSLDVPAHDDAAQLWINGEKVWDHAGCCDSHTGVWSGWLGANDKIELRLSEAGGGAAIQLTFISFTESVVYVDASKPAGGNGAGWATAFNNLQDALAAARTSTCIKEIWVAKGTYYPDEGVGYTNNQSTASFVMKDNLAIYGGFSGSMNESALSQRDWKTNPTVLSGDIDQNDGPTPDVNSTYGNSNVVVISNSVSSTAVLDGFTITAGRSEGGMKNNHSSPAISNCVFSGNGGAGGISNYNSSPAITSCIFSGNKANNGGGMYNQRSMPVIVDCEFSDNKAGSWGGGMHNADGSKPILTNCRFLRNTAGSMGGGMMNFGASSPTLINCIFVNNGSTDAFGGGIANIISGTTLTNCSFSGNSSRGGAGALYNEYSSASFTNCILWGDNGGEIVNISNGNVVVSYSDVQGGYGGENNLNQDPLFVDAAKGDLRLQPCSPLLNKGDNSANTTTTDLAGNARIFEAANSGVIDLGAYEYGGSPQAAPQLTTQPLQSQTLCENAIPITLTVAATGTGLTYQWYSNAANANSGGTKIDGAQGSSYTPSTGTAGTTYYYAVVSGDCNTTPLASDVAAVTVSALQTWYRDADGDSYGDPLLTKQDCVPPNGYVANNTDCNDADNTKWQSALLYIDADNDTYTTGTGETVCFGQTLPSGYRPTRSANDDCNDQDPAVFKVQTWYQDSDGDGFYSNTTQSCSQPTGTGWTTTVPQAGDCNDGDNQVWQSAVLYADADNDTYTTGNGTTVCFGQSIPSGYRLARSVEEDCDDGNPQVFRGEVWYQDADNDGYATTSQLSCGQPAGSGWTLTVLPVGDCNDSNKDGWQQTTLYVDTDMDSYTVGTGEAVCHGASIPSGYSLARSVNDDCDDGDNTKHASFPFYTDSDGDGYGTGSPVLVCAVNSTTPPTGYSANNTDCDDANSSLYTGGQFYVDSDGDGYGAGSLQGVCGASGVPTGYSTRGDDCDDTNPARFPGATDLPDNGVDEDCDGADLKTWYEDKDGDGFGNRLSTKTATTQPTGYVANSEDCDDTKVHYEDEDMDGFGSLIKVACGGVTNSEDCNDNQVRFRDSDGDGFGTNEKVACGGSANNGDCNDNLVMYQDNDGDGFGSTIKVACLGVQNSADCDDTKTTYQDNDGDRFGSTVKTACGVAVNTDCNDGDATIYPDAPELLDQKDNNCNGMVDEGLIITWYRDKDGDGFGNPRVFLTSATKPVGYVSNNFDCDDNYITYEDMDNDGWGTSQMVPCSLIRRAGDCNDNDRRLSAPRTWYRDADGDKQGDQLNTMVVCQGDAPAGFTSNGTDCDDTNPLLLQRRTYYEDKDGDGFGNLLKPLVVCSMVPPTGYVANSIDCDDIRVLYADNDKDGWGTTQKVACGGAANTGDCNDQLATVYPGAPEVTNGRDDNCNGQVDETAVITTYYRDADVDGFGNPAVMQTGTSQPPGYVTNNGDCDDTKVTYQDMDNDGFGSTTKVACGGVENSADCNDSQTRYLDGDGDGFGSMTKVACGGVTNNTDCNDADASVNAPQTYYPDSDGDGFGNASNPAAFCSSSPPSGYVTNNSDCDDTKVLYRDNDRDGFGSTTKVACGGVLNNTDCHDGDNTIYPSAPELADGKDNNCNGQTDESAPITWYRDKDGDGFGNPAVSLQSSTQPTGYVSNSLDCDDNRVSYRDADNDGWGTTEKVPCGWISRTGDCNDGDRRINQPRNWYRDADGDKYGNPANFITVCQADAPTGYVSNNTDCNDNNPLVKACETVTAPAKQVLKEEVLPELTLSALPNPFAANTMLRYSLPADGRVSLRVVDATGRTVGLLFEGHREAGAYNTKWNGSGLAGGLYYVRLTTTIKGKDKVQTLKVVKAN